MDDDHLVHGLGVFLWIVTGRLRAFSIQTTCYSWLSLLHYFSTVN